MRIDKAILRGCMGISGPVGSQIQLSNSMALVKQASAIARIVCRGPGKAGLPVPLANMRGGVEHREAQPRHSPRFGRGVRPV